MGTKLSPGKFDCVAAALPDEPMFTLLARDKRAPACVRKWAREREIDIELGQKPESDRAMVEEARVCANQMDEWRTINYGKWRK